jgi:hypothetical protein
MKKPNRALLGAYYNGARAERSGKPKTANPYAPPRSRAFQIWWNDGWQESRWGAAARAKR